MTPNILFIGGAGFIGSNLIKRLKNDCGIYVIEPKNAYLGRLKEVDVVVHECSLSDVEKIKHVSHENDLKTVVHLVSTLIPGGSYEDYKEEYKKMIFPSIELMEFCAERGVKFVYFSSSGTVYGNRNDVLPFVEQIVNG